MKNYFVLILAGISLLPTSAFAQMTGTLITRTPAQTDIKEKGAARKMSRGFTRCVAERSPGRVKVYLDLPVGSKESNSMGRRLTDREGDECMGMGELMVPDALFRGGLYEALYLREFATKAVPDFATIAPIDYSIPYIGESSASGIQAIAMARFADCVVRKESAAARALMFDEPLSSSEAGHFVALAPHFSTCLPKGQQFSFSKSVARGALAEGLYRLSSKAR